MDNYEQKYKNALSWMQSLYKGLHGKTKEEAETYFPELKESEDERIRKHLIEGIKCCSEQNILFYKGVSKSKVLAWLEKQGEQKPAGKVEPKFKIGQTIKKEGFNLGFTIVKIEDGFYYNNMGDYFPFTDQDNWELIEQKPADMVTEKTAWSEEDKNMLKWVTGYLENKMLNTPIAEERTACKNAIAWLEKLKDEQKPNYCHHEVDLSGCSEEYCKAYYDGWNNCNQQHAQLEAEQKFAWSEEDKAKINRLITYFRGKDNKEFTEWFSFLLHRSIPKQEWSEEDKKMLKDTIRFCELCGNQVSANWLKSLRPQNRWKPSEGQMDSITCAVRNMKESACYDSELVLLYQDLKKLREE